MTFTKQNTNAVTNLLDELFINFPNNLGKDIIDNVHSALNNPPVNIYETNDGYHLEANAAGLKKEDFKIQLDKNLLTISYAKQEQAEEKNYKTIKKEFSLKSFKRSFSIDEKVNTAAIQAKYENGILRLYIPKKEEVKIEPTEITIQ